MPYAIGIKIDKRVQATKNASDNIKICICQDGKVKRNDINLAQVLANIRVTILVIREDNL